MKNLSNNIKSRFLVFLLLMLSVNLIYSQTAVFDFSNQATQSGVSIAMNGIDGPKAAQTFCDGSTKLDVIQLNQSASSDPTVKYIEIASAADISSIDIEANVNSTTAGKTIAVAYWNGPFSTTPDGVLTVGVGNYGLPCGSPATSIPFPAGVKTVRLYRKVNYDGTTLGAGSGVGDGTTTNFLSISVFAGPPPAELFVSPAVLTGIAYPQGSGPSAASTFNLSGTNVDGSPLTITGSANYEVSSNGSTWGPTATLVAGAGTLSATPIYVRLKAGLSIALYNNETITVSGGGAAASVTVDVSGSVSNPSATTLAIPTVGSASAVADVSAIANWTPVANALGYTINVYQGATLITSQYAAGQATASIPVSGLTALSSYTYKVVAVGDGLNYLDSNESAASIAFVTSAPADPSACNLTLYDTDFTDWGSFDQSSANSTDMFSCTGGGDGFTISQKPIIDATGDASGFGETGYVINTNNGSSGDLLMSSKMLPFVNGGTVVIYAANASTSTRDFSLTVDGSGAGITTTYEFLEPSTETEKVGDEASVSGNTFTTGKATPDSRLVLYKVIFDLPAGLSGNHQIIIESTGNSKEIAYSRFRVCTNPPATPYVATTNFSNCVEDATGLSLSGTTGSSTPITGILSVKGWNITGDVTMTITGPDAGLFTIASTTLTQAAALTGQSVGVDFTPSVISGISKAELTLSSPGAPSFCVSLTGLSISGASPEITTPVETWQFPSRTIDTYSQDIPISGMNLTGPVTLSIVGGDAAQFSLSQTSMSIAEALAGAPVTVTYLAGISAPSMDNTSLVLTSPGAASVTIPLEGITYTVDPTLFTLTKVVTPAGSGILTQDIAGSTFASGTTVKVTVNPQTGWKFVKWTDNGSTALIRSVLMTSDKTITALFEPGSGPTIAPFNAYTPLTVNNTSFTARWGAAPAAASYVVTVYDETGAVVYTSPSTGAMSVNIPGLTQASQYTYEVTANTGDVSNTVSVLTTGATAVPACGTVN